MVVAAAIPALRIEAFLPAFAWARWTLGDRVEIGVRAELQGNKYAVRDARIQDSFPCSAQATGRCVAPP